MPVSRESSSQKPTYGIAGRPHCEASPTATEIASNVDAKNMSNFRSTTPLEHVHLSNSRLASKLGDSHPNSCHKLRSSLKGKHSSTTLNHLSIHIFPSSSPSLGDTMCHSYHYNFRRCPHRTTFGTLPCINLGNSYLSDHPNQARCHAISSFCLGETDEECRICRVLGVDTVATRVPEPPVPTATRGQEAPGPAVSETGPLTPAGAALTPASTPEFPVPTIVLNGGPFPRGGAEAEFAEPWEGTPNAQPRAEAPNAGTLVRVHCVVCCCESETDSEIECCASAGRQPGPS